MQNEWKPNTKALAAMMCSCASLLCCMQWMISLLLAVIGVVLGILGLRDENPNQEDAAIAGIVVGVVGMIVAIVVAVLYIILSKNTSEQGLGAVSMLVRSLPCA